MILRVYLPRDVIEDLKGYGEINGVVNRLLKAASGEYSDLEYSPPPREVGNDRLITLNITEHTFLDEYADAKYFGNSISLRKILCYYSHYGLIGQYLEQPDMSDYTKLAIKCMNMLEELIPLGNSFYQISLKRAVIELQRFIDERQSTVEKKTETDEGAGGE